MKFLYDPIKGLNAYPPPPGVRLSQGFGQNLFDYSFYGWKGHNGWDIAAPLGTPIYAAHDGWIVEQTDKETGYGLRISQRIQADKHYLLIYAHMQRLEVPDLFAYNWNDKSRFVRAGQVIGYVNSTGNSSGHHLHFDIREMTDNGSTVNINNGYGGAIDPEPLMLNKEAPMSNVIFVHKEGTSEYGFYVPATLVETLKDKALNFGLDITNPDGSVDFAKAKEMNLNESKV